MPQNHRRNHHSGYRSRSRGHLARQEVSERNLVLPLSKGVPLGNGANPAVQSAAPLARARSGSHITGPGRLLGHHPGSTERGGAAA